MTKAIQIRNMTLGKGIPKICVPLTGKTREALLAEAEKVCKRHPDLVEWRADFYEALCSEKEMLDTLLALRTVFGEIPLLFTIRTLQEGGAAALSGEEYAKRNLFAAKTKLVDLIDVELFWEKEEKLALISTLRKEGAVVIASSHDFQKTDAAEVLKARFLEMDQSGADILKMAVMPQSFSDVLAILQVTDEMAEKETEKPVISMSMGRIGTLSRICGEFSGSSVTFGTVVEASAPGQIPIEVLRDMMEVLHGKEN